MASNQNRKKVMVDYYDDLYSHGKSFREEWEGLIGIKYKVPKEVSYFVRFFRGIKNPSVLEVGAGDGTSFQEAREHMAFSNYVLTEISQKAVEKLRKKGFSAEQMDAARLKYTDGSFDIVCSYNTMHHVDNPSQMGKEMLRISRRYVFLSEANGLCIIRKLLEKTKRNRMANEKSYTPRQYIQFFSRESRAKIKRVKVIPFGFVFAFTPRFLIPIAVYFSELLEKIPAVRWQGSSLAILIEKR